MKNIMLQGLRGWKRYVNSMWSVRFAVAALVLRSGTP